MFLIFDFKNFDYTYNNSHHSCWLLYTHQFLSKFWCNLTKTECGQYNEMWHDIHCMPEETARAGVDVKAKKIMPIHWAGFKLAAHDWRDPIIRVQKKADEFNLPVITPQIGEEIFITSKQTFEKWWKKE